MSVKILGTGSYLPPKVVTNDDLARTLDTSDEWIYSHTGIHSRHVADADDCTSAMAAKAARKAMEAAQVEPADIGLIIVATSTPDYATFPSTACLVQAALGCPETGAYDMQAACAGFVYALEQARCWVRVNTGKKALVIGAETLTRIVDWRDRGSCILFGDGAGAVVVGDVPGEEGPAAHSILWADGNGARFIYREGGTRLPAQPGMLPIPCLVLQGHDHCYEVIGPVDSTLYFIGATCGAKRYTPLTREEMDASKHIHHVENYFDLFSHLAQPGAPSYTRVTVSKDRLKLETFAVQPDGSIKHFNTITLNK